MQIEGTKILALPRADVWRALNDAAFLQATVPGATRVSEPTPDRLEMELTSSVGPIKVNFSARVQRLDVLAPESLVLQGAGSGGVAGSATGRVLVRLTEISGGTQLSYNAQTEITGRIAQLGARLIDSTARKFSEEFFANVAHKLSQPATTQSTATVEPVVAASLPPSPSFDGNGWKLALDGVAWRVAMGAAGGTFVGALTAGLLLRIGS